MMSSGKWAMVWRCAGAILLVVAGLKGVADGWPYLMGAIFCGYLAIENMMAGALVHRLIMIFDYIDVSQKDRQGSVPE